MIEHVVVMTAGRGERMGALTRTRPKAMLPILGKPMVARVMDGFYGAGVRRFTVVVGEQDGSVAGWLSRKWHPDVDFDFVPQGHHRGTASALFAARQMLDEPFVVASCDNLIPENLVTHIRTYFDTYPCDVAVLSLLYAPGEVKESSGVLRDPRGHVIYISEKPVAAHQDFMTAIAVYGFTPRVLEYLDQVPITVEGERVLTTAIQTMIDDGLPVGGVETEWRIHLTRPNDLLRANMRYLAEMGEGTSLMSEILPSVQIIPPVYVDPGVLVGPDVIVGPNVYLETGSVIGPGATLQDCVVLGARVSAGQQVKKKIVIKEGE